MLTVSLLFRQLRAWHFFRENTFEILALVDVRDRWLA